MGEKREILYHIIDWVIALIGIIGGFKAKNIVYIIMILIIATGISIIIVLQKKIYKFERELSELKQKIGTYESLLNSPYPLYGIANYISKDTQRKYNNDSICLEELYLDVKLVNDIVVGRHNDLQIFWELKGINISQKDIDKLYLRIGGDSSTAYENLAIKAVACSENARSCEQKCHNTIETECSKDYEMSIDDVKEYSTKTFHLLKMEFTSPVNPHKSFDVKVRYTWPQCFNPHVDFLLIDPNNFAQSIEKLFIRVHTDGKILTENSVIFMHSIYMQTNEHINEGKFTYIKEEGCFICEIENTNNEKMYYVKIKNN